MRKSIDDATDDHPPDADDRPPASWAVMVADDCLDCEDLRVVLTLEEVGAAGMGVVAHLSTDSARRLRTALRDALGDLGADPGP